MARLGVQAQVSALAGPAQVGLEREAPGLVRQRGLGQADVAKQLDHQIVQVQAPSQGPALEQAATLLDCLVSGLGTGQQAGERPRQAGAQVDRNLLKALLKQLAHKDDRGNWVLKPHGGGNRP
jgi:hypothetical protein